MRSPENMEIIEIDITNACVHACSNCTRFCGHHKKTFFMSFDVFKRAVDSLENWSGMIGIIGGEPTLHPEFERFMDYLRSKRVKKRVVASRGPIQDMQLHILANLNSIVSNTVLLSSMAPTYYKHFETINDTFEKQLLNDHRNSCEHQALLMDRHELGINDEEWILKRDACWIQNTWSATITPKGAFFCEVAGALDMLFDGPGGWDIEKGWYKRKPEDFKEQLQWCEMCSACLDVPKRLSNDERDDVSLSNFEKLKKMGSPKALNDKCVVRDPREYERYKDPSFKNGTEYINIGGNMRASEENRSLYPKNVIFCEKENFIEILKEKNPSDWVAIGAKEKRPDILNLIEQYVLNPGCLYIIDKKIFLFNVLSRSIRDIIQWPNILKKDISSYYPLDKIIYFSLNDKYLMLSGGNTKKEYEEYKNYQKLIVYGAGEIGKIVINNLNKNGITDFLVAVTKKIVNNQCINGYSVFELSELKKYRKNSLILLAVTPKHHKEMIRELEELGFSNYRFIS